MAEKLFGGIEAGGTKFNCAIASSPQHIVAETRIPTTTPTETMKHVVEFFLPHIGQLHGIGLGCFGPFDVDPASPAYGHITATAKPHWSNTDVVGMLREKIHLPIVADMDVAVAGLGESTWGASQGDSHSLYLTIGTGIGGGYIVNGNPLRGLASLEMGHIRIPHNLSLDPFRGACPFHGDCFEGLASGPALEARLGERAENLKDDHPVWELEAGYIASALVNFILSLSPKRIILGGGVMQNEFIFPIVRNKVRELMNGYIPHDMLLKTIDRYIVPPALGGRAGVLGSIALAMRENARGP